MKKVLALILFSCLALSGLLPAAAQTSGSNWPSLDADGAQSNSNQAETTLTTRNILRLTVKWTAPLAPTSYPIVSGGQVFLPVVAGAKIHVHVLNATTGKLVDTFPKDAAGGLLLSNGALYLAGHVLQSLDPANGDKIAQVNGSPHTARSTFIDPEGDDRIVAAGYVNGTHNSIYTVDPGTYHILDKLPSASAAGTLSAGHILTGVVGKSVVYDEQSGQALSHPPFPSSNWFAGSLLAYTVASPVGKPATLYAYQNNGIAAWHRVIGPILATQGADWPHAVGPNVLYVQTFKPAEGIQALDAISGKPLWYRPLGAIQHLVLTRHLLLALTYGLGEPVKLQAYNPSTGKLIGAITLSSGYFAFGAPNALIAADGMVFVRVIGPSGPQLVALGTGQQG